MSRIVRCDWPGCEVEAESPGYDRYADSEPPPKGWKTGPKGDFCPAHPTRVRDGE